MKSLFRVCFPRVFAFFIFQVVALCSLSGHSEKDVGNHLNQKYIKGRGLYKNHNYKSAAELFEQCLAGQLKGTSCHRYLGYCYQKLKSYDKSIKHFDQVLQSDVSDYPAIMGLARTYFLQKKFEKSLKLLLKSSKLKPDNQKLQRKIAALKKRIATSATGGVASSVNNKQVTDLNTRGLSALKQKKFSEAISLFREALDLSKDNVVIRGNLAAALRKYGNNLGNKQYDRAKELLIEAVSVASNDYQNHFSLGILEHHQKNFGLAEDSFSQAEQLAPKPDANLLAWRGSNLELQGKLRGTEECWVAALAIQPDYPSLASRLALLRRKIKVQESMVVYERGNFCIRYFDESGEADVAALADALQVGYDKLHQNMDFSTNQLILVNCYSRASYSKVQQIGWSAGEYDGTIALRVESLRGLSYSLESTLIHEFTHYANDRLSGGKIPIWLDEGLADYISESWGNRKSGYFRKMILGKQILNWSQLTFGQGLTGSQVNPQYIQAYTIAEYLVETYGYSQLRNFMDSLQGGETLDDSLRSAFQGGLDDLQKEWLEWAKDKYL